MTGLCRVCGIVAHEESRGGHAFTINCERCGVYRISDTCAAIMGPANERGQLNTERKRASVGFWLRDHQRDGSVPLLRSDIVS